MDNKEIFQYLHNTFSDYIGMIFFAENIYNPKSVCNSGTVSFINTGKRQILVTCLHVYTDFKEKKKKNKNLLLGLAGKSNTKPLNITNLKILSKDNNSIDLITMELPNNLSLSSIGCKYFKCDKWPPCRVKKNDVTAIVGFLGEHRHPSIRGLETPSTPIVKTVSSVSERNFILSTEDDEIITIKFNKSLKDINSLGGLSGSAVFKLIEDKKQGEFSLTGFVYEEKISLIHSLNFDLICHHADLIDDDGNISDDIIFLLSKKHPKITCQTFL